MRRCIELMLATAGGTLADAPARPLARAVAIRRASSSARRGWPRCSASSSPWHAMEQYLVAIGATVVAKPDDGRIAVDVPGWRPDLSARDRPGRGDRAAPRLRQFPLRPPAVPARQPARRARGGRRPPRSAAALVAEGLFEVVTPPDGPGRRRRQRRACSTRSRPTMRWLRRRLLPGLVRQVERNWANHVRGRAPVRDRHRLFAPARPASARGRSDGSRPCSPAAASRRTGPGAGQPRFDLWDLKGRFEAAVALANPGGDGAS